jgi:uncharacterized membrane protein
MNSNKRIAATVYSLGTLSVSGIYVQIPCIKEIMTIIIIIIIIIMIFINCNWAVTRWQWLFYMYTNI